MASGIELDIKSFSRGLNSYIATSGKDPAAELNRRMKRIYFTALQLTKSADPAKIRAYMQDEKMMYKLVPGRGISKKERAAKARRLLGRVLSSVRYIKAGYYKGGQAFGARGGKIKEGKSASRGWGKRATAYRLVAEIANASFGAEEVSGDALQAAINKETDDMLEYIWRKLEEGWGR